MSQISGERIKKLREMHKIKQADLAEKIGTSPQNLSAYENGGREPNYSMLMKLCEIFNCSADYLIGKSNQLNLDEIPTFPNNSLLRLIDKPSFVKIIEKLSSYDDNRLNTQLDVTLRYLNDFDVVVKSANETASFTSSLSDSDTLSHYENTNFYDSTTDKEE